MQRFPLIAVLLTLESRGEMNVVDIACAVSQLLKNIVVQTQANDVIEGPKIVALLVRIGQIWKGCRAFYIASDALSSYILKGEELAKVFEECVDGGDINSYLRPMYECIGSNREREKIALVFLKECSFYSLNFENICNHVLPPFFNLTLLS